MKKAMMYIGLFTVVLLSLSAHTQRVSDSIEGLLVPEFKVSRAEGDSLRIEATPGSMRGRWSVVQFWNSRSAQSRIEASRLDALCREMKGHLGLLAVNTDNSERLFREIVRRDGLDGRNQYHADASLAQVLEETYGLDMSDAELSARTFLISPDGHIEAVNPGIAEIRRALKKN